ncbi:arsenate reductase (azurin) large subunit [Notoacmeibacter marinus]|uniref:Arsenate reductase (Azurin) large subunit n=1 Tax=Notoacmeibacter marinus TaxID=1876515 RepID=A0A231V017_9HYPH|nr:arsenate reductase (azurin) large subunit [Notoacmeibacter marinus]OXT01454.1 arsenate reductase (azurin) large subunit [Notoacmeibacter marinus]
MTTPYDNPDVDVVPLPPVDAEKITTACDYCIVACGYLAYRWPVGRQGGPAADQNALGIDFPTGAPLTAWVSPNQHNIVDHEGRPHHVIIIPDPDTPVVNVDGNHSIRGGTLAQKLYNPTTPTRERLREPMIRVVDTLTPVSWDVVTDVMAEVSKYVLEKHGVHAWGMKTYSYEFFENTYAISKLVHNSIGTPIYAPHDKPQAAEDTPGLDDAGINAFSASYDDWGMTDVAFCSGVDPYETKTVLFTSWMMYGDNPDKKMIMVTPHRTMGVQYALENGGLWLPVIPGSDTALHLAISKIILQNNWQDQEFIDKWIANRWEVNSGYGRGTRNTRWQWRTTWGRYQSDWEDYQKFIMEEPAADLAKAAEITGLKPELIEQAAEMIAKPKEDGTRVKTSFMLEKGNYWSNNYMNTASLASLGLVCGAGNRPGQVISRGGGHQRGWMGSGPKRVYLSPEKHPGRRKKSVNVDRWVMDGNVRFMWVMGTVWFPAMLASQELGSRVHDLVKESKHQPRSVDRDHLIEVYKKRVDEGGMVLVNSDIYPVDPLNTQIADIVLPAAAWGEEDRSRCNAERRLRLYSKIADAPGDAKSDWWAIAQFAQKMGFEGFEWENSADIFEEAARFSRTGVLSYYALHKKAQEEGKRSHDKLRELGTTGIQTPIRMIDGELVGTKRLHDPDNDWGEIEGAVADQKWLYSFGTHSGKALLLRTPWENNAWSDFYEAIKPRAEKDEVWITNGRVNETWQSGFDDRRKPYLAKRWPWPYIFIHPEDAEPRGIESGDLVEGYNDTVYIQSGRPVGVQSDDLSFTKLKEDGHITTTEGSFVAVAIVSDEMRPGVTMANFNYPGSQANSVCHAVPDPVSGNYRYKLGRGVIRRVGESPYKNNFDEMSLKPRPVPMVATDDATPWDFDSVIQRKG